MGQQDALKVLSERASAFRGDNIEVLWDGNVLCFTGNEATFFPDRPLTAVCSHGTILRVAIKEFPWGKELVELRGRLSFVGLSGYEDRQALQKLIMEHSS